MRLEGNPLFRKISPPWYDCNLVCWMLVALMGTLSVFGWVGLGVARANLLYQDYIWVPAMLLGLCFLVIFSVGVRMAHRFYERFAPSTDY